MSSTQNKLSSFLKEKQARLSLIKQNLNLNPDYRNNMVNKVLVTSFFQCWEILSAILFQNERGLKIYF